jgi:hypothetical protein
MSPLVGFRRDSHPLERQLASLHYVVHFKRALNSGEAQEFEGGTSSALDGVASQTLLSIASAIR